MSIFVGRQPILDKNRHTYGHELLFHDISLPQPNKNDPWVASADTIIQGFNDFHVHTVLSRQATFIRADHDLIMNELSDNLGKTHVVFEIVPNVRIDEALLNRCKELKAKGIWMCLTDFVDPDEGRNALIEIADMIKIDFSAIQEKKTLPRMIANIKACKLSLKFIAYNVNTPEESNYAFGAGFNYAQGYYFSRPMHALAKREEIASKPVLLRLITLVLGDASNQEIEYAFKQNPEITKNLIDLVNSIATGLNTRITTIDQALLVLGRKLLQRWLQLLLFMHGRAPGGANPLLQLAAMRGRLMENLATHSPSDRNRDEMLEFADHAFMTGVLSLIDVLINAPIQDIMGELTVPKDIKNALLGYQGELGEMLAQVIMTEKNDFLMFNKFRESFPNVDYRKLSNLEMQALAWAINVGINNR